MTLPENVVDDPDEVPHFKPPVIQDNVTGWGPCDMPEQFKDMPYQPFSKGDRLGKVIKTWVTYSFTLANNIYKKVALYAFHI